MYSYVLKHGSIPNEPIPFSMVSISGIAGVTVSLVRTPMTDKSLSTFHECTQADTLYMPVRFINPGPHVQSQIQDLNGIYTIVSRLSWIQSCSILFVL